MRIFSVGCKIGFFIQIFIMCQAQDVIVTVDRSKPVIVSQFQIGVTHTHGFWEFGHADAVAQAKELLDGGVLMHNQHIMGWGAGNPMPDAGTYYWNDLDRRIDLLDEFARPMVISFCTAPGWMKEADDWAMDTRVADDYFEDFASLCAEIASRYEDVVYFQVWNEMKGFWSGSLNNWDYVRYTQMYNAVYDAVMAVRPDAKIGGPYLPIQGDGAVEIGRSGRDTFVPIGSRDWTILNYWLENKRGADFICFDYGLIDYHDNNSYSQSEKMKLTKHFGLIVSQLQEVTDLPVMISEYYGGSDPEDAEFTAANHASCYAHSLVHGAQFALVWNPEQGELDNYLFTDTAEADGGQATPHYDVVEMINTYFSAGTQIVESSSSSEDLEVLAAEEKTLLINKLDVAVTVSVNGSVISVGPYEVKLIDTPENQTGVVEESHMGMSSKIQMQGSKILIDPAVTEILSINIYNVLGELIHSVDQEIIGSRRNEVFLDRMFSGFANGTYIIRLKSTQFSEAHKFYLAR